MTTLQEEITSAVATFTADKNIMHQIVHGDFTTEVATEGGNVKSLAKAIADLENSYTANAVLATTQDYKNDAYGWAEFPVGVQFTSSTGVQGYSARHWAGRSEEFRNEMATWIEAYGRGEVVVVTADMTADASVNGFLLSVDASAGDVEITLEDIAVLGEPYSLRVVKRDASENTVTIQQNVGDTINGSSNPIVLSVKDAGYRFDSDADPDPQNWSAISFGSSASVSEQVYYFTATAGQTVFSGPDDFGRTLAYEVGHVEVKRGVAEIWAGFGDFTAADGVSVVLDNSFPLSAGEQIVIRARSSFAVASTYSVSEVDALIASVPTGEIGSVSAFAMESLPTGWLACDGAAVSRTAYPDLFAALGTTFGAGDGSTTFNLPDLRGEFIRGFDDGRGVDAGRVFGAWQDGEIQSHVHDTADTTQGPIVNSIGEGPTASGPNPSLPTATQNTIFTSATGGDETRPRNVALVFAIKAFHAAPVLTPGPQGVNKAGDTMTGNLVVPAGTLSGHAVNKAQLDVVAGSVHVSRSDNVTHSVASSTYAVPQISEGVRLFQVAFTASSVDATIEVEFDLQASASAGINFAAALFVNDGVNAVFSRIEYISAANWHRTIAGKFRFAAPSAAPFNVELRMFKASAGAGTASINYGEAGTLLLGGTPSSSMTIREVA